MAEPTGDAGLAAEIVIVIGPGCPILSAGIFTGGRQLCGRSAVIPMGIDESRS